MILICRSSSPKHVTELDTILNEYFKSESDNITVAALGQTARTVLTTCMLSYADKALIFSRAIQHHRQHSVEND